ncbi:MAG: hypothetical protein ACJAZO_000192 [Myxococcota bacterium]|jgi:hypothetical protein
MTPIRRLRAAVLAQFQRNADLIAVWVALAVAQQQVPITHFFGREDLLPWVTLTLSIVALIRGRALGPGPHPMLTPRIDSLSWYMQKLSMAVAPWGLLLVYDAARTLSLGMAGAAFGVGVLVLVCRIVGASHGQTAWRPVRSTPWLQWTFGAGLFIGFSAAIGLATTLIALDPVRWVAQSMLLGAMFVSLGLIGGRVQHHQQRRVAGLKGGRAYRPALFPLVLAGIGPTLGYAVVQFVLGDLPFTQAFVVSLLVIVWGAIVWPSPEPHAVAVMLYEVAPTGGRDVLATQTANPFDAPPEGALRFNPLRSQRTRTGHPWLVPVVGSRIEGLDDPVAPLWPVRPPFRPSHTLGDARFEPHPLTRETQTEVLTLHLKSETGAADLSGGQVQTKRTLVLRAFIPPGFDSRQRKRTYTWEQKYARDAVQVLDATLEICKLVDGDIIMMSQEGVAHAYEVEMCAPIYRAADAFRFRPAQLEDYVEAG